MRRVGIVAVVAALALPLTAQPAPAVAQQEAFALWVKPEGKKLRAYFALAERYVDPAGGGIVTAAGVAKGTCQVHGGRRFQLVACSARGRMKEIPFEDFVLDPTLARGTMKVEVAGATHEVEWIAADAAPSTGGGAEVGPYGAGAGAGMGRDTTARGNVFGKSLETRGEYDFSLLAQSAGFFVSSPVWRDGKVTFSFRR